MRHILLNSPVKTCSIDPLPTDLLLESVDTVLPFISLCEGHLPSSQKKAVIMPTVKKANLGPEEAKNYRPISNLAFVSKVIERIVSDQVRTYLTQSDLMPPLQSAYRPGYSTETAVLKVHSDIINAADTRDTTGSTRHERRL